MKRIESEEKMGKNHKNKNVNEQTKKHGKGKENRIKLFCIVFR